MGGWHVAILVQSWLRRYQPLRAIPRGDRDETDGQPLHASRVSLSAGQPVSSAADVARYGPVRSLHSMDRWLQPCIRYQRPESLCTILWSASSLGQHCIIMVHSARPTLCTSVILQLCTPRRHIRFHGYLMSDIRNVAPRIQDRRVR